MSKQSLVLANVGVLLGAIVLGASSVGVADTTKTDSSMSTEETMGMEKEAGMKEGEMGMEKEAGMKEGEMGMEKETGMKEGEMGMEEKMEQTGMTSE